jgi:hypothetical protein
MTNSRSIGAGREGRFEYKFRKPCAVLLLAQVSLKNPRFGYRDVDLVLPIDMFLHKILD